MRIYLLGFMGAGKTRLGKELAEMLGYSFFDLDQLIVNEEGFSINTIFEKHGETYFRELEKKILHRSLQYNNAVISTGGGTPCFFNNMEWINKHGIAIYLDVKQQVLAKRLWKGRNQRPLLSHLSETELLTFIYDKIKERESFYLQAAIHYQVLIEDQKSVEELFSFLQLHSISPQNNDKS